MPPSTLRDSSGVIVTRTSGLTPRYQSSMPCFTCG